jgi:hypothetical protein
LEQADDWIVIGDLTISVGKLKCLATLGVRMKDLELRDDLTLAHKDVEVLGIYPTEKSTGEFAEKAFEDSSKRVGSVFFAVIIDQGSDIKNGAKRYQQNHSNVKILHDISHKLSNLVEHELEDDKKWLEFIQKLNLTRRRVYQTELAALMPKRQRDKARYMDIGYLIEWPEKVRDSKTYGFLSKIAEERYQDYLGWVDEFITGPLKEWGFIEGTVKMIKGTIREHGLSLDVYSYIKMFLEEASIEGERLQNFISKALNALWEEVKKLDEGQILICSTEVLESIFGKYKAINEGLHGITGNILGICTFVGEEKNVDQVKKAMENCSVKKAVMYVSQKFGQTLSSLRKKFFPNIKGTKFDNEQTVRM